MKKESLIPIGCKFPNNKDWLKGCGMCGTGDKIKCCYKEEIIKIKNMNIIEAIQQAENGKCIRNGR